MAPKHTLPTLSLEEICNPDQEVRLQNFTSRDGNISHFEIYVIVLLIKMLQPKTLLEVGTFDGNTTMQMALNAPKDATIHTIDLPQNSFGWVFPTSEKDLCYICDEKKHARKFLGTSLESKIVQHFGDSGDYDFCCFAKDGPVDFCFIDGSHTYEGVKSDTKNALKILSQGGIILWHDYSAVWPEVKCYLEELSAAYPLRHIKDSTLAFLRT